MSAPALTAAATSLTVLAIGGAANLIAAPQPLQSRIWLPSGGFVGVTRGAGVVAGNGIPVNAPVGTQSPPAPTSSTKKVYPIGGKTDKPMPPTPFGKFPRHRPSKLPGPPKSYDPNSP